MGGIVTHGTRACYRSGCRRPECRAANAKHVQDWRRLQHVGKVPLGRLVPANEAWQILRSLEREHFRPGMIAALLGLKSRCPRIQESVIRLRTALKFRRLARLYLSE